MDAILNDRYLLQEELGQGGMGTVYKGYDATLKRDIAIKILIETAFGTEGRSRLIHEAQAIARLNHPNIVTVFDAGETDLRGFKKLSGLVPFIVMEYVEGVNLYDQPPDSIDQIVTIAQQICAALEHAHANGIIHRDLKPENIIITPDGAAKLMDFGLARSVASRLTSEGTIVGTVFYLAPEQALGQGVNRRADLYSLGVMLYEFTTGGLPFTANDPLAVISQHIHAPVVPPNAKNEAIPTYLNDLILRLLSKDPADRPETAAAVSASLAEPDMADPMPGRQPSTLDRIVRGRIVGREPEFDQSRILWKRVLVREGQTLLISGEPGIGKTRLVREIASHAEVTGGQALIGNSFAEGGAPYEAFEGIVRQGFRRNPNDELGLPDFVMADLISLVPSLRIAYPELPPNPPLDPKSAQQRLFESVVAFCKAISEKTPLLLVVDDIHWADSGTLSLFRHLARRMKRERVLLLGTYREVELDAARPFIQVLADLNRERLATRIKLNRLTSEQTGQMLANLFDEKITDDFRDGIFHETEGNPFFIEEVCKALIDSGKLYFEDGRWHRPSIAELEIPQSVRVAIQSRINTLPEDAQEILQLAAVLGRAFEFETLLEASEFDEDLVIDCLESAEKNQLIEEISSQDGVIFGFTHALIPATLVKRLSTLRRRRLHHRVAIVVEALHPEAYQRLAYHWGEAGDEDKGLDYMVKAADQARKRYANEDAIRYYTQALEIIPEADKCSRFDLLAARTAVYDAMAEREAQLADAQAMLDLAEVLDDAILRCKALLALAECDQYAEFTRAFALASQALEIARSLRNPVLEAWALSQMGNANNMLGKYQSSLDILARAADLFQQEGLNAEAARCLHTLSVAHFKLGQSPASLNAAERAVHLSRAAGDKRQEAISLRRLGLWEEQNYVKKVQYTERALAIGRQIGDRDGEMDALNNLGLYLSVLGKYEDGRRCLKKSIQIAEEVGYLTQAVDTYYWVIIVPLGEYEAGLKFMRACFDNARRDGNHSLAVSCHKNIRQIYYNLGQYAKLQELLGAEIITHAERVLGKAGALDIRTELGLNQVLMGDVHAGLQILEDACQQLESLKVNDIYSGALVSLAFARIFIEDRSVWLMGLDDIKKAFPQFGSEATFVRKSYALCIQARLYLKLGQIEDALAASTEAIEWMEEKQVLLWQEYCFITHVQVLRALGHDEEGDSYLQKAYERLMLVAGKTKDDELRRCYLENVPENREILKQAKARGWCA